MPHARSPSSSSPSYSSYTASSSAPTSKLKSGDTNSGVRAGEVKSKVDELENLREMLAEKKKEFAEEEDVDRKKDIKKDMDILEQWLHDKEHKHDKVPAEQAAKVGKAVKAPDTHTAKATSKEDSKPNEAIKKQKQKAPKPSTDSEVPTKKSKKASDVEQAPKQPAVPEAKKPKKASDVKAPKPSADLEAQAKKPKKASETQKAPRPPADSQASAKNNKNVLDVEKAVKKSADSEVPAKKAKKASEAEKARKMPADAEVPAKKAKKIDDGEKVSKPSAESEAQAKELQKAADVDKVKHTVDKDLLAQNADLISRTKEALQQSLQHQQKGETPQPAAPPPASHAVSSGAAGPATQETAQTSFVLASEATTLMPSEKVPPCELPLWCVRPNPRDVEVLLEIVRHVQGSSLPSKRMRLGRRAWALLGRRLHEAQAEEARRAGVPEPDIGLACPLSSKAHALVLQNWTGKIFLKDLGSAHGTFLGGVRLNPHEPFEWKAGMQAYFADASTEFFELRAA
ncbi:unnamed protein product [Symbiodinium pilosum]|uniref:FHA domain-containing protein n=1 Tax=Symbiodinium pilosum TaxID=2952 RepID=A0A812WK99_SYMPI|nr:unnamed protein product [Symbiodinium pilosum]